MFAEFIENLAKRAELIQNEGDYVKKGILYCGKCNEPKQRVVHFQGNTYYPTILCKCQREQEEKERRELIEATEKLETEKRRRGIKDSGLRNIRFENDDGRQPDALETCKRYVGAFAKLRENGYGMLLYGPNDKGKTFYTACIANELIDQGYSVLMQTLGEMVLTQTDALHGRAEKIDVADYDLIIIDEFGVENSTATAFSIIDDIYNNQIPLIITTNLDPRQLLTTDSIEKRRIYNRIVEMCALKLLINNTGSRKKLGEKRQQEMLKIMEDVKNGGI